MTHNEKPLASKRELEESIKEKIMEQIRWITDLAAELGNEGDLLSDVFALPPEVRDDAPMPDWADEQEAKAREVGRRFGYGAEQDVNSGLIGGVRIAEGGKVWKIMAEVEAIKQEHQPTVVMIAGSPHRKLGEDEITFLRDQHNLHMPEGATEYDAAKWVSERFADGQIDEQLRVLDFGYEIAEGNVVVQQPTGQLVHIGETSSGQSVQLLRVDRENYEEDGVAKYRYQPNTANLMNMVSAFLKLKGDETSPVALATSNTYASRQTEPIRAGLSNGRPFGVVMYGRQTLRELNAAVPAELPLNHLPGDLRQMHDNLQSLLSELS